MVAVVAGQWGQSSPAVAVAAVASGIAGHAGPRGGSAESGGVAAGRGLVEPIVLRRTNVVNVIHCCHTL